MLFVDFITQNLLGGIAGQAALGPRLGRRALPPAMLGGAVPDFDVLLTPLADPALPFLLHRHFTHALLFIPVGALLAAAPFMLLRSYRAQAGATFAAALVGCATHGPLDDLTSYGTHLWWPFTDARTAQDLLSIIDPIVTGVLLLGVVSALVLGRAGPARAGLALFLAYLLFAIGQQGRASAALDRDLESRGVASERTRLMPTIGNAVLYRALTLEGDGRIRADAVRVGIGRPALVRRGATTPRLDPQALPATRDDERMREVLATFTAFTDGWIGIVGRDDAGRVLVADLRFSIDPAGFEPLWGVQIDPAAEDPVRWVEFHDVRAERFDGMLRELVAPDDRYRPVAPER